MSYEGGNEIATSSSCHVETGDERNGDKEAARVKAIYDRAPNRRGKKEKAVCGFRPVNRGVANSRCQQSWEEGSRLGSTEATLPDIAIRVNCDASRRVEEI